MLEQLLYPQALTVPTEYSDWRNRFMLSRLRIVLIIGTFSVLTFIFLNLSRYPNFDTAWLSSNLSQEVILLFSLGLLHTQAGRSYPALIFLLLSWSITIIPQFWFLQAGIAKFDFVTWTLVFLVQATFIPVQWPLHLFSQLGLFICFFLIRFLTPAQFESQIANADITLLYLYVFWFCIICNIAVYLYERLQYAEFKGKRELQAEQQKSERLLLNILPSSIAERLKQQDSTVVADDFSKVTVLFADIVGFTEMSARMSSTELVELLNKVFSVFDTLVATHNVEKIKTIGDAYMVVAGLPTPHSNHVEQIADLALDMRQSICHFNEQNSYDLSIRIGIHTGPVIAGVIGIKKFAYDLWGDTVNTASRMESHGIAGQIQISDHVHEILKEKYIFIERGPIQVKGKGEMMTYLLQGKQTKGDGNDSP